MQSVAATSSRRGSPLAISCISAWRTRAVMQPPCSAASWATMRSHISPTVGSEVGKGWSRADSGSSMTKAAAPKCTGQPNAVSHGVGSAGAA